MSEEAEPIADATSLPTLDSSTYWRFATLTALYVAQGLPWGLFTVGFATWLAAQGVSTASIATFVGISTLPWSFKLLVGPFMDRFSYLPMGRRRPWVIFAQSCILLGYALLALAPDPAEHILLLAGIGFIINSFCATQDVAVDGMAIDVLPEQERGRANAFMFGGQVIGISTGSLAGGYALTEYGLVAAAAFGMVSTAIILIFPLLIREREGERLMPWSEGESLARSERLRIEKFQHIFKDLLRELLVPMSVLLVLCECLFRLSDGILFAYLPVFTVKNLGWDNLHYNSIFAQAGVFAAVFGLVASVFIDRKGAQLTVALVSVAKFSSLVLVVLLPGWWSQPWVFESLVYVSQFLSQVILVAIIAMFMKLCGARVAATQFAVYMAISNLAYSGGAFALAGLSSLLDARGILLVCAACYLVLFLVFPKFRFPEPVSEHP